MSAALLDVNFLVALFDPDHTHYQAAHAWLAANRARGWATCPLTENGVVRVLSHSGYSDPPRLASDILARLVAFRRSGEHTFWPDDVSLCEERTLAAPLAHSQITDLYLLALAVRHQGSLVTFDRSIPLGAVAGAKESHLVVVAG